MTYSCLLETPSVTTYRTLRSSSGLSGKPLAAAERGLPRTLFAVLVIGGACPLGMGRVVGDISVLKQHQGKGIRKMIMAEIVKYPESNVTERGHLSLIADGQAHNAQFGFVQPRRTRLAWR